MDSLIPSIEELKQMFHLASSRAMWVFFAIPIFLLLGIGLMAERSTASFAESQHWVSHTQEVRAVIENLRADMYVTQDFRKGYLLGGDSFGLESYTTAREQIPVLTAQLRHLTADNPRQQARLDELEPIIQSKLSLAQQSIDLRKSGNTDLAEQAASTRSNDNLTQQMSLLLTQMVSDEDTLLAKRVVISADTYKRMRLVLAIALVTVVLFLLVNFGRLLVELLNRTRAEAAVRRLSGRILQLQDMERRKIARELHDGVGQYFASSKMTVDSVLTGGTLSEAQRLALTEASQLLEQGVAEARTLSHLLHPPLLDEIGFRAAADWFIKGFSERSKINVQFTAPTDLGPMTKEVELVLFRVLQESLTNIHRHAGSTTAEVRLFSVAGRVTMEVEDQGKGIPEPLLDDFRRSTGTGVGLAGMRERVSEFHGSLEIESQEHQGTLLKVEMPLPQADEVSASAPPTIQATLRTNPERTGSGGNLSRMIAEAF